MAHKIIPIVKFLETFYTLPEGGTVKLYPHQKKVLEHVFTPDDKGLLPYKELIYSTIKKSAKSTLGSMVAVWYGFCGICPSNGEIYFCASDLDQSSERSFRSLTIAIRSNPVLEAETKKITDRVIELKNGITFMPLAADFAGAAGSNPNLSTFDELWTYESERSRRLWDEMCVPPTRENGMRIVTTYAGFCLCVDNHKDIKILTDDGWLDWDKINTKTKVATRRSDFEIEFNNPSAITNELYSGDIVRSNHRRAKFTCTPDHRILLDCINRSMKNADGSFRKTQYFKEAADLTSGRGSQILATQSEWNIGKKIGIFKFDDGLEIDGDTFCSLAGWYISEGNVVRSRGYTTGIQISQSTSANLEKNLEIKDLLNRVGNPKPTRLKDRTISGWCIYKSSIGRYFEQFGLSDRKYIPDEIKNSTKEQILIFLKSYLAGDASRRKSKNNVGAYVATTVSERLALDLCEVGQKAGYSVRYYKRDMNERRKTSTKSGFIKNPHLMLQSYEVVLSKKRINFLAARDRVLTREKYNGRIWCPTIKNGNFFVMVDGYCFWTGNSNQSVLLESIYKKVVREENKIDLGKYMNYETGQLTPLPCYIDGDIFCLWDHEGRFPWHTSKYFKSQEESAGGRRSAFLRIHRNEWVDSSSGFEMTDWEGCVNLGKEKNYTKYNIPVGREIQIAVGIDASTVKDRTSVVTVFRKDGKFWLGERKVWQPSKADPLNFEKTIEEYIMQLNQRYFISVAMYDPWQMVSSAQRLSDKGIPMVAWPQTITNTIITCENLLDNLRQGGIVLYDDQDLTDEAKMVTIKEIPAKGRRITKENSNKKIDSIIALSMALYGATKHLPDWGSLGDQFVVIKLKR